MGENHKHKASRRQYLKGLGVTGMIGLAGCNALNSGDKGGSWTIGTSTEGSAGFDLGQIKASLFQDHSDTLTLDAITTPGYFSNVELTAQGEIDVAQAWGRDVSNAHNNEADFADEPVENPPINAAPAELSSYNWFVTYEDSDIETLQDIEGRDDLLVNPGPAGAGTTIMNEDVLRMAGVYNEDQIVYMSFGDRPSRVRERELDLWTFSVISTAVNPADSEVAETVDIKPVPPTEETRQQIEDHQIYQQTDFSREIAGEVLSDFPESWPAHFMVASSGFVPPDASDDLVREYVRTLVENQEEFRDESGFAAHFGFGDSPLLGLSGLPEDVPVHPAAAEYYQDEGLWDDAFDVYEG